MAEGQQRVFDAGITGPEGHALSRPAALEGEATARAIRLAEFVGTPLYVVHVMSRDAMEEVGRARWAGMPTPRWQHSACVAPRQALCLALPLLSFRPLPAVAPCLGVHGHQSVPLHLPSLVPGAGSAGCGWLARRWPQPSPWMKAACGTPTLMWRRSM